MITQPSLNPVEKVVELLRKIDLPLSQFFYLMISSLPRLGLLDVESRDNGHAKTK